MKQADAFFHPMPLPSDVTVYCLCAAWCRTCDAYAAVFQALAARWQTRVRCLWVDIEDQADLVGDVDVEAFPCLLIADRAQVYFFGPVLPHASVAAQLIDRVLAGRQAPVADAEVWALGRRLFQISLG